MKDSTFCETDMQYHNGVCLEEYNGEIGICRANRGKDGKIYVKWGHPQVKDKKPSEKPIPWKVTLGTKEQAIEMLETFVSILKGAETQTGGSGIDNGEIPF